MDYGWFLLLVVGWAFGLCALLLLFRMAGDQDRAARRAENVLFPFSDVPITEMGPWRD